MSHQETIETDVVIVGSGIAGALTAYKLATSGVRRVLVLEAGPRIDRGAVVEKFRKSATDDLSYGFPNLDSAPRPDWSDDKNPYMELTGPVPFKMEYLRVLGGTTWHWGGCTPRFRPVDFRLFSSYGVGLDWPIDYAGLEPFYTEAEEEIGVAGEADDGSPRSKPYPLPPIPPSYADNAVAAGLKNMGIDFIARPTARASLAYRGRQQCQGYGTCSPICPSGAQYSAIYHVEKAIKAGVRVLENTRVDRIVANGPVTHLEAARPDGTKIAVTAKIFVLAANAFETPRLLLMSASESCPKGLANSSLQVGRNFMEHPFLACNLLMPRRSYTGRGPRSIVSSASFRDGPFRKERPGGLLSIENGISFYDIANRLLQQGKEPPDLDASLQDIACRQVKFFFFMEQLPDPRNAITLNWDKRDRAGQPLMQHYYSFGNYEKAGFAFAHDLFGRIANSLEAKISNISDPSPSCHLMGTTRMGKDPGRSVTDGFGRCHDHKNLFIAGSSLFPSGGTANPTLTIAALSLRTAGEIARQLAGSGPGAKSPAP